ncbi:MAG: hypothetical protein ACO1PZ_08510, partial [Gammaproteobacteria bacterium]
MYEFLFKYPQQAFADSEFVLASGWPLWLLFTLGAIGLALIAGFLIWKRASMKWWQLGVLGLVQAAMLALVLFVIWQPALVNERLLPGENAVAIMLDTSASMALNDGGSTRMAQAQQLLTPESLEELGETYTILPYGFADGAEALPGFGELPEPGTATILGQSILQTLRQASSSSLGAVILVSDGADNNGAIAQNELSEIVGFGVPIHTVGIGREAMPEDLEIEEVVLPNKALAGTTLSARVNIRHDAGGTARVKVYNGDEFLSTHDVELDPEQSSTMALIDIEVPEPGQLDLRFTVDPINGERNLANNSRSRVVDVPEGRYKILYVEGEPRWEYKFMQRALTDDPSIQLSTLLKVTPNKFYRQGIDSPEQLADGFPTERSELFAYDALIIGSMQVAEFTQEQQEMIRDFVSERGGSLMMLAGLNGLGLGGWGESVVNEVLPSRLSLQDAAFVRQKAPVVLTDAGRAAPMLKFSDSDTDNVTQWSELPEIADYQSLGPLRPAATTLLEVNIDGRNQPLLVSQPYGRGQSFILATGGTWRWQMSLPLDDLRHETFWRQLARNLVANSPRPFELTATVENENILVRAELRDPDAEENQGLAITAVASSDTNEVVNLELLPVPGSPGVYEAAFSPASNGLYSIEALSRKDDDVVSSVRTATRYDQGQESFGVRQNRALLERIAAVTGGNYWTPAQWGEIPEAISYSTAGITQQQISYLWDAPFFFLLLFALKVAEWLLRRAWRVI